MTVTAYVTRDIGRTFGVTHGPITRSDPIRSDPALLQLHRWSPSHHGVQLVTRASAPIVAPSPVTVGEHGRRQRRRTGGGRHVRR